MFIYLIQKNLRNTEKKEKLRIFIYFLIMLGTLLHISSVKTEKVCEMFSFGYVFITTYTFNKINSI